MPDLPTTARGAATRRRILDTAVREFADRGIAGARIDRIVAAAHTNKAQLYGYFGSKEGLFDAVLADCVQSSRSVVPFDAEDLPGWAVRVYDENLRNPDLIRLMGWIRLEQRPTGLVVGDFETEGKLTAVARAQAAGKVRAGDPAEILIMILAMGSAWSPASGLYAASTDEPAAVHDRRRAILRESVERAVAP